MPCTHLDHVLVTELPESVDGCEACLAEGSGWVHLRICLEYLKERDPSYPVIVDAGVGSASDVSIAMELGADGVLLNTAVAHAKDPVLMAHAMRHACIAGRQSALAGRIPRKLYASASSPASAGWHVSRATWVRATCASSCSPGAVSTPSARATRGSSGRFWSGPGMRPRPSTTPCSANRIRTVPRRRTSADITSRGRAAPISQAAASAAWCLRPCSRANHRRLRTV